MSRRALVMVLLRARVAESVPRGESAAAVIVGAAALDLPRSSSAQSAWIRRESRLPAHRRGQSVLGSASKLDSAEAPRAVVRAAHARFRTPPSHPCPPADVCASQLW